MRITVAVWQYYLSQAQPSRSSACALWCPVLSYLQRGRDTACSAGFLFDGGGGRLPSPNGYNSNSGPLRLYSSGSTGRPVLKSGKISQPPSLVRWSRWRRCHTHRQMIDVRPLRGGNQSIQVSGQPLRQQRIRDNRDVDSDVIVGSAPSLGREVLPCWFRGAF